MAMIIMLDLDRAGAVVVGVVVLGLAVYMCYGVC